jgi:hypothetical protein
MAILKQIEVRLRAITEDFNNRMKKSQDSVKKFNNELYKQQANFRAMNGAQKAASKSIATFRDQNMSFGQVMGMNMERFKSFNQQGYKFNTLGGRTANRLRMMTHGMKGFRMEMLGAMFFGMALTRTFGGSMRTSMEWMGVNEVLTSALGMLFMPVAEILLDWALRFMDWVGGLSEEQKKWIGIIVLSVAALGILLMIIGQLALGLGSIILVLGKFLGVPGTFSAVSKAIAAAFTGITAPILAIIAIIVAVVIGMVIAWKNNFLNMKQIVDWFISGVKDLFGGLISIISGILKIIKGIFTGDWDTILEGVTDLVLGFVQAIWGLFKMLVNGVTAIIIGIVQIIWNIIKLIWAPFEWFGNFLIEHTSGWVKAFLQFFKDLPGKIVGFFKGMGQKIADIITGILPDWMIKLFKAGGNVFGSLKSGIGNILGFAEGGVVPGPKGAPVPALVHGGETIIPPGGSMGGQVTQNITVNATVSSDYDVRRLAEQLNRYWANDSSKMRKLK